MPGGGAEELASAVALSTDTHQLDPEPLDGEAGQVAEAREGVGVELAGEVLDLAAGEAAGVGVGVGAAIVAGRAVAVSELRSESAGDEGLEGLVHSCEGDIGNHGPHRSKDVVGGRVLVGLAEEAVHRGSLIREALATGLQRRPEQSVGLVGVLCLGMHPSRRVVLRRIGW